MGTITAQVVEAGQTTATKNYAIADADIDKMVAAFQSDANVFVNGTATRAQVLLYIFNTLLVAPIQAKVQAFNTTPPVVPPPISIA